MQFRPSKLPTAFGSTTVRGTPRAGEARILVLLVLGLALLQGAVLGAPTPSTAPLAALVQAEGGAEAVPGQYIVVFRDDVPDPRAAANEIAQANGFAVRHVYTAALEGFSARIPEAALFFLQRDSRIAYIEQDRVIRIVAQTLPAGIDRVDADQNGTAKIDGIDDPMDVDVAIIDTGIDLDHPDLDVVAGTNCLGGSSADDDNSHGTHVAGTVAAIDNGSHVVGVAPGARLWAVKVLDASGSGTFSSVICGIDFVTENAASIEVANMSLGAQASSDSMRQSIQASVAAGVFYAAAAGNDARDVYGQDGTFGTSDDFIPAAYPEVAAVSAMADFDGTDGGLAGSLLFIGCGAVDDDTFAACFSNFSGSVVAGNPVSSPGAAIDLAAPGVQVLSTTPGGGTGNKTGTSMASPHVAGAAALFIVANGRATDAAGVAAIRQALIDGGQPQSQWQAGDTEDPDGNLEPLVFVGALEPPPPPTPVTDVAVTGVSAPSSVTVGDLVSVDVTVENIGTEAVGAFDVTLTDITDAVTIGTQSVSGLAAGASTTLTYSWDTSGASFGSHTLEGSHDVVDDDASNDAKTTTVTVNELSAGLSVTGITPDTMAAGTSVDVTITGSGFVSGASVSFENGSGPAPSVGNVVVVDANTITATVTAKSGGPPRNRVWDVRVTNPDGATAVLAGGFTITP